MPLARPRYRVYLDIPEGTPGQPAGPAEHEIEITHGDQLRGELEAAKQGLPEVKVAPMNHTTVWVWCALVRLGLYHGDYRQFKLADLQGLEPVRDEAGEPETAPVDPTQPAAGTGSP